MNHFSHIYLRFLTSYVCNYSCSFCHNEGIRCTSKEDLPLELYRKILSAMNRIGLHKIKFVGGEPLLSPSLEEYISDSLQVLPQSQIGITSNGFFTENIIKVLERFPHLSITISLPSINAQRYYKTTGSDSLTNVLSTVEQISSMGGNLTINTVVDSEEHFLELPSFLEYCFTKAVRVKLIIPCNTPTMNCAFDSLTLQTKLLSFLAERGWTAEETQQNQIKINYADGMELNVTVPYCPQLCKDLHSSIQTIRLTPDGIIKACLLDNSKNIKLASNISEDEIFDILYKIVSNPLPCDFDK